MNESGYSTVDLYFFSGTGNAEQCTRWMADIACREGSKPTIHNIAAANKSRAVEPPRQGSMTVFCAPTHGFNYPQIMRRFIAAFPRSRGSDVVLLNTRAGTLIGNAAIPGLSGIALYHAAFRLILKGYRIRGLMPVDLPSNWLSLHPAPGEKTVKKIFAREETRVSVFTEKILAGKTSYPAFRDILQDAAISPVLVL